MTSGPRYRHRLNVLHEFFSNILHSPLELYSTFLLRNYSADDEYVKFDRVSSNSLPRKIV